MQPLLRRSLNLNGRACDAPSTHTLLPRHGPLAQQSASPITCTPPFPTPPPRKHAPCCAGRATARAQPHPCSRHFWHRHTRCAIHPAPRGGRRLHQLCARLGRAHPWPKLRTDAGAMRTAEIAPLACMHLNCCTLLVARACTAPLPVCLTQGRTRKLVREHPCDVWLQVPAQTGMSQYYAPPAKLTSLQASGDATVLLGGCDSGKVGGWRLGCAAAGQVGVHCEA